MKSEFKYGLRNHKIENRMLLNNTGGAYPEIHFIQNISEKLFFFKNKIFNKSSMFSFFLQKKKTYLFIKKNIIQSNFDSENLKVFYRKILNLRKSYSNQTFKNYSFTYFTRKINVS